MKGLKFPKQRINYWREVPRSGRTALQNFTPQMFTVCMGTGILAVLLKNNPYQFRGLATISVVVWLLDLLLFAFISAAFATRWILFPGSTAKMFSSDIEQTTYLSTTAIATATLTELVSLEVGSIWDKWQYVCFAFWWATLAVAIVASIATYWLLIRDEEVHMENLNPTLMYPVTGLLACASAGSVLVSYTPLGDWLSMPVLIVSYIVLGAGFFLAILTISAYFLRLMSNQLPPPKKVAAQLIPIAALSNAAYSFSSLGYLVGPKKHISTGYGSGPLASATVADAIYGAGFLFSITIFGFATFWLFLSLVACARDLRKTVFNLNMWSAAYPLGAYGVASTQLAIDLDSTAFKVISTIILILLVIYWLFLVICTVPMIASGELFLSEAKEKMIDKKHEEREREGRKSESTAV